MINQVHAWGDGVLELQYGHLPGLCLCLFFQWDVALIIAWFIGSGNTAKIIFIYCCLYMFKNSAGHHNCCLAQWSGADALFGELMSIVSLLIDANKHISHWISIQSTESSRRRHIQAVHNSSHSQAAQRRCWTPSLLPQSTGMQKI